MDEAARFCPGCGAPAPAAGGDSGDSDLSAGNPTAPPPSGYKTELKPSILYGRVDLENLPKGHLISDRYTIKEKIGRGGFGAVYRVYDSKFAIDKALKVLPDAVAHDRSSMEILRSETRTMGWLNHPNIIRLYDFEETGPVKYLDMEYVSGGTLADLRLAAPEKKLSEKTVRALGARIAGGLAYAHQNSVIHRDIKPDNILVAGQQQVKIMDFGISETLRTSMTRLTSVSTSGTLVYMSPEQIRGKRVGRESDIYSFGAMLYELLSGHPPFYQGAVEHQIINEPPAPIPGVSDDMNRFLQICLAKDFSDRFSGFKTIEKILSGKMPVPELSPDSPPKSPPEPIPKTSGTASRSAPDKPSTPLPAVPDDLKSSPLPSSGGFDGNSGKKPSTHGKTTASGKKTVLFVCLGLLLFVLAGVVYFYSGSSGSDPSPDRKLVAPTYRMDSNLPAEKSDHRGENFTNDLGMKFVWIQPGTFTMGSPSSESGRNSDERQHRVTLTKGFHMQTTEVTQGHWKAVVGTRPWSGNQYVKEGDDYPAAHVSWDDARAFIQQLSQKTGQAYRLPTEAEWEYACRAGSDKAYCFGNDAGDLGRYAWYDNNADAVGEDHAHAVAQKLPNTWGLYDMHGNVWEWCQDWKGDYPSGHVTDPTGPTSGANRVLRGGSWDFVAGYCRSAYRAGLNPGYRLRFYGFRLVCLPGQQSR